MPTAKEKEVQWASTPPLALVVDVYKETTAGGGGECVCVRIHTHLLYSKNIPSGLPETVKDSAPSVS